MTADHVVAKLSDLEDGQMKEIKVNGANLLLVRVGGEFFAVGATCPHEGAPLAEGLLHGHHIRCPWHQSVFDARNGESTQPPTLEDIQHYDVRIQGQSVVVTVPEHPAESVHPSMAHHEFEADPRTFAILGTGAAGLIAAETLRREGFVGRVVVLTREAELPYDRTELSKGYLAKAKPAKPFVRSEEFYREHNIEILTKHEVTEVNLAAKEVRCRDGFTLPYDKVLLATGSQARTLGVPGEQLANVFRLRSYEDCERIRAAVREGGRAVVIGGSFIAMEVGASLAKRGMHVTVVLPGQAPFENAFGQRLGKMFRQLHEENGVVFKAGRKVKSFESSGEGAGETLAAVTLDNGESIPADLAVVGVGVQLQTGYINGLRPNEDGSINVDRRMAAAEDVYAAGDIAQFPDWRSDQHVRIEHWRLAEQLGRTAAQNMAGRDAEYRGVPFFWTNQFKLSLSYVGFARQWDDIVYDGQPEQRDFVAYYISEGHVIAAAGVNQERKLCLISELMRTNRQLTVEQIHQTWDVVQRHAPVAS